MVATVRMIVTSYSGTPPMIWRPVGRRCWDVALIVQRRKRRISGGRGSRQTIPIEIAVTLSSGVCAILERSVMRLRWSATSSRVTVRAVTKGCGMTFSGAGVIRGRNVGKVAIATEIENVNEGK
jgi:hypothetical protein